GVAPPRARPGRLPAPFDQPDAGGLLAREDNDEEPGIPSLGGRPARDPPALPRARHRPRPSRAPGPPRGRPARRGGDAPRRRGRAGRAPPGGEGGPAARALGRARRLRRALL